MTTQPSESGNGALIACPSEPPGPDGRVSRQNGPSRSRGGGPKTTVGKAKSAQNSVQHAITSPSPVAGGESLSVWEAFHEGFRRDYQPIGVVEEELVHNMASYKWRVRRVLRAEVAAINIGYEAVDGRVAASSPGKTESALEAELSKRGMTLAGCCELLDSLQSQAGTAELNDPAWNGVLMLLSLTGRRLSPDTKQAMPKPPCEAESFRAFLRRVATEFGMTYDQLIDLVVSRAHSLFEESARRNAEVDKRRKAVEGNVILPNLEVQEKFIRYEAHLEKLFAKALAQLEVQQRFRIGERIAPPMRLHVSEGR